jgi:ATP-dependent DNA ligase
MNRFAELVDRLSTMAEPALRAKLLAHYLECVDEMDRSIALSILAGDLKLRTVKINLIRGLLDARVDPILFSLSNDFVGDVAETIALLWPTRHGANKDPTLREVVEALSTLGRSELPRRIETWLDATNDSGRWALIKLISGTLRIKTGIGAVSEMARGQTRTSPASLVHAHTQSQLFAPPEKRQRPGTIDTILMYVERINQRARKSPLRCTFGVWQDAEAVPIGKADLQADDAIEAIEKFATEHTINRFGPVREVLHTTQQALIIEVAFDSVEKTVRRTRAGIALQSARIISLRPNANPTQACTLSALETLASST